MRASTTGREEDIMGFMLAGPTARQALRYLRCEHRFWTTNSKAVSSMLEPPTREAARYVRSTFGISDNECVHFVVRRPRDRRLLEGVSCTVFSGPLPARSFAELDGLLLIPSPELLFLQMHSHLSDLECIALGFELCGHYSWRGSDAIEFSLPACTTPGKLKRYLDRLPGVRHRQRALSNLRYLCPRSASPRETQLALLLGLPHRYGGYGFEGTILNKPINVSSLTSAQWKHDLRFADISWEGKRIAVEYDSGQYHSSAKKLERDAKRRTLLQAARYQVVTVTNDQLKHIGEMDRVAITLAKLMGKRRRIRAKEHERKKRELHRALMQLNPY